jgi:hypothetical protein
VALEPKIHGQVVPGEAVLAGPAAVLAGAAGLPPPACLPACLAASEAATASAPSPIKKVSGASGEECLHGGVEFGLGCLGELRRSVG